MQSNYRFHIQPIQTGAERCFRLAVALAGDDDAELVPAYRSAFTQQVVLKDFHATEEEVRFEMMSLKEWLNGRSLRRREP